MQLSAHRTNVVLDEIIVQKALKLSKIKTKRVLIDFALNGFIGKGKKHNLNDLLLELNGESPFFGDYKKLRGKGKKLNIMDLMGVGGIHKDYDYKALRGKNLPELK